MPQSTLRSGLVRTRFRLLAALLLVAVTAAACNRTPVAKVTRADGPALIGELVGTRPDVVVLRIRAGEDVTISRAAIQSIEIPTVDEWARHSTGADGSGSDTRSGIRDSSERGKDGGSGTGSDGSGTGSGASGDTSGQTSDGSTSGGGTGGSDANRDADGRRAGNDGSNSGRSNAGGTGGAGTGGTGGSGGYGAASGTGSGTGSTAHDGAATGGGFVVRDAVIPEDTALTAALDIALASDRTAAKTPIEATLTAPVNVAEGIALPIGTRLRGAVTEAVPGSLARGRGRITLHFHSLVIAGETIPIDTDALPFRAPGLTRDDAKKIGIGAAIGAGIGKVVSKTKRGLGIGGAAGAAATAAAVNRKDVELARGAVLRIVLNEPVALGAARDR